MAGFLGSWRGVEDNNDRKTSRDVIVVFGVRELQIWCQEKGERIETFRRNSFGTRALKFKVYLPGGIGEDERRRKRRIRRQKYVTKASENRWRRKAIYRKRSGHIGNVDKLEFVVAGRLRWERKRARAYMLYYIYILFQYLSHLIPGMKEVELSKREGVGEWGEEVMASEEEREGSRLWEDRDLWESSKEVRSTNRRRGVLFVCVSDVWFSSVKSIEFPL